MHRLGKLMSFPLRDGLGTGAQVLPLRLQIGQRLEMLALRRFGIFGPEAELDLSRAGDGRKVVGDALTKSVNSGFGMLPGTCHRKCHVYHPCVPLG
jgi:hypothetical protein